jgi:hypothetical protein
VTDPLPLLYCGAFEDDWMPPWSLDELLPELLEEPSREPDELEPEELEPEEVEPEEVEPEELDPVDVEPLPLLVTAAWLVPGRTTAITPAASTLAADTATVVVFSRRRPSSRSATACATWRALAACAALAAWPAGRPRSAFFSQLFTTFSLTWTSVRPVGELSENVLSAMGFPAAGVCLARACHPGRNCQY